MRRWRVRRSRSAVPTRRPTPDGTLTIGADGRSGVIAGLVPGTYTLTESAAPAGYQSVAPVQVAVAGGLAATVVDVEDHVQPATLRLLKVDRESNAPLAGAVFDVRYDSGRLGHLRRGPRRLHDRPGRHVRTSGDDGSGGFLPGNYEVTEVDPPSGYALDQPDATQRVSLAPGGTGVVTFDDSRLVAASFEKKATGNVDPASVSTAGAVFAVAAAPGSGPSVATCTTDGSGSCTTAATLVAGDRYCWSEPAAPPGLAAATGGCFTATDGQAASPIEVTDRGEFVALDVDKVDAANHTDSPGRRLLRSVPHGQGRRPDRPTPPAGAPSEAGETWTARATTGHRRRRAVPAAVPRLRLLRASRCSRRPTTWPTTTSTAARCSSGAPPCRRSPRPSSSGTPRPR